MTTSRPSDARQIRRFNEHAILLEVRRSGPLSKPELADRIDLTRQAVNIIVEGLVSAGLLQEGGKRGGSVGAPSTLYVLHSAGAYSMGVALESQRVELVLVDFSGAVLYRTVTRISSEHGALAASIAGAKSVLAFMRQSGIPLDRLLGIGLAIPDLERSGSKGTTFHDVVSNLGAAIDLPVWCIENAAAASLGERMLSGQIGHFLYVQIGEDVRASLQLRNGPSGVVGVIGALPDRDGESLRERLSLSALFGQPIAETNAEDAREIIDGDRERAGRWLRDFVDSVVRFTTPLHMMLELEALVIEADLPNAFQSQLLALLGQQLADQLPPGHLPPSIQRARLGRDSAALGAAMKPMFEASSDALQRIVHPSPAIQLPTGTQAPPD